MIVYGIGLPRCGGQTLAECLRILGMDVVHSPGNQIGLYRGSCTEVFRSPDVLRQEQPGCKFIMNVRDIDDWLASCSSVYHRSQNWNHTLWRYPLTDFRQYAEDYMRERRGLDNCLYIDITDPVDATWTRLCRFLGLPEPNVAWPMVDRFKTRKMVANRPSTEPIPPVIGSFR